jgi:hypothetical protein
VKDRATGAAETVTGAALVAADGAASLIRSELGLRLEGPQNLSHIVNCYFRADIEPLLGGRKGVLFFVSNPSARGVLQPLDGAGRWLCQITVQPEEWSLEVFHHERVREWVRAAVGVEDLEAEVRSVGLWKLNSTVVERFVQGRVLMCGDAAHQFPPTGGLGVNTGLQGMHNAMWKLALCIQGRASWPLVETYHAERREVAQRITSQSLQNAGHVLSIFAAATAGGESAFGTEQAIVAARRYGNHLGVEFGAAYQSSAVVPDGTSPPNVEDSYTDYVQSATPGCRAPHVWLGERDAALSSLDLFGPSFTLLTAEGGAAWRAAADAAASELHIPIASYTIGGTGLQDRSGFARVYGLESDGAVLVRPDGHVAWRSPRGPAGSAALSTALAQILALARRARSG